MIRSKRLAPTIALILGVVGPAAATAAASVYPGCATPPAIPSGAVHYVDPVHGGMSGDGTRAHPWSTLTEVIAAGLFYNTPLHGQPHINPGAPIQAGDTVYLLSGDHGPVRLQGWFGKGALSGYDNARFITIAALPGQTPVISQLTIVGASGWVFRGLTIESTNNTGAFASGGSSAADYWLVALGGPHYNIVFDGDILRSSSSAGAWSRLDWLTERASGIREIGGSCVALTNNTLSYVGFGLATQSSSDVLISGNKINYFSDDGIDYGSSNMVISSNTITNSVEDGDGFHRDGMQGQPYTEQTLNSNIDIINNTVIRIADPKLATPAYLQGIDTFDGLWSNVNISNNIVITDAGQGISYYGVNGLAISKNILLYDGGKVLPCSNLTFAQCQTQTVVFDTSTTPTIYVTASKAGLESANVTVTSNLTSGLGVSLGTTAMNIADNTCLLKGGQCGINIPVNGQVLKEWKPGTYAGDNVISNLTPAQEFVDYDPVNMIYNLTVR